MKSLLFENQSSKQTIVKNTIWLVIAEGFSKGWIFVIAIFIAKFLWPEQFGVFSFVVSFVTIFVMLMDFWFSTLLVREVSKKLSEIWIYLFNLGFLKLIFWIITFISIWIIVKIIWNSMLSMSLVLIYSWYAIINNFWEFIRSSFRPSEKMEYEAILKIINWFLTLVIVLCALFFYGNLESIMYGYLIASMISLVVSMFFVINKFNFSKIKFRLNRRVIDYSIRKGAIIGWGFFLILLYMSSDQIILWFYWQINELGVYALAYKIVMIYSFVSTLAFASVFPKLNQEEYKKNFKSNYKYYAQRILIYNTLLFLIAEVIIYVFLYESSLLLNYENLYIVVAALLFYQFFEPIGHWWYINLIAMKKENINLIFLFITAVINIIWNILLIPDYSYYWAIGTTITSYIIYSILTFSYISLNYKEDKDLLST